MASDADILRAARALIDAPEKWTQGAEARDADGRGVFAEDPSATCFCSIGALARAAQASGKKITGAAGVLRMAIFGDHRRMVLSPWNDDPDRTHAEVLAAFDRAITLTTTN